MTLEHLAEAEAAGARRTEACALLGLSVRTVERWKSGATEDLRQGPKTEPGNKLAKSERQEVLAALNSPKYRDLSPSQIVPALADTGVYLASESTMYRILREEDQLHHRERSKTPVRRPPREHVATGPEQVWSWDITYLRAPVQGMFFYLYLVVDVWSRKVVGWEVNEEESSELASALFERTCAALNRDPKTLRLVVHSDNGGPMKGATLTATFERLGVQSSFSRPHVSDDNPFSEALFRTLKYRPEYPTSPFASLEEARQWVAAFVAWYNTVHLHSAIRFVTPEARHSGRDLVLLAGRKEVYEAARTAHPERWSRTTRCWDPVAAVYLNPEKGGLGAAAPSGAGQSPVKAHQKVVAAEDTVAPPAASWSTETIAPYPALPNRARSGTSDMNSQLRTAAVSAG